jgi:hypothetical protein
VPNSKKICAVKSVFNELKVVLRIAQKKHQKKLEVVYKGGTFAPATTNKFLTSWQANERGKRKFSKNLKKHLRD